MRIHSGQAKAHGVACALAGVAALVSFVPATGAPQAAAGYTLSQFAGPLSGSSAPDSIAVAGNSVFVGYGNSGAPDGSGGAVSTIAEYNSGGSLVRTLSLAGHNDGLRYNAASGQLWAIQNEDGNANLVFINPKTGVASSPLTFAATAHGGGYDDVAFGPGGAAYISASNPLTSPNSAPAIGLVNLSGSPIGIGGVLNGNATATVINGGGTTTLNLQDPDSLIFAPNGQLVLDSQGDQQLVFVSNVGTPGQSASVLNLPTSVDDTVFGSGGRHQLLFADRGSGIIYALTGVFGAGQAFSAGDSANVIANVDLSTGAFTDLVTGLNGPHGEAFGVAVPEPATWTLMMVGFGLLGVAARRGAARSTRAV